MGSEEPPPRPPSDERSRSTSAAGRRGGLRRRVSNGALSIDRQENDQHENQECDRDNSQPSQVFLNVGVLNTARQRGNPLSEAGRPLRSRHYPRRRRGTGLYRSENIRFRNDLRLYLTGPLPGRAAVLRSATRSASLRRSCWQRSSPVPCSLTDSEACVDDIVRTGLRGSHRFTAVRILRYDVLRGKLRQYPDEN